MYFNLSLASLLYSFPLFISYSDSLAYYFKALSLFATLLRQFPFFNPRFLHTYYRCVENGDWKTRLIATRALKHTKLFPMQRLYWMHFNVFHSFTCFSSLLLSSLYILDSLAYYFKALSLFDTLLRQSPFFNPRFLHRKRGWYHSLLQELLDLKMWKDMALLDRRLLKICRSAFYGTPGICSYSVWQRCAYMYM